MSGDDNLYAWRQDPAHPAGQITFIGSLDSFNDVRGQSTPSGGYFVFSAATPLVATDTDNARDVYRYDAETGVWSGASTNISGVGGNGDDFDSTIDETGGTGNAVGGVPTVNNPGRPISDDGSAIVFTTSEALSPLDGNEADDVYLWKAGRVSLITTGSVGGGGNWRPSAEPAGTSIQHAPGALAE